MPVATPAPPREAAVLAAVARAKSELRRGGVVLVEHGPAGETGVAEARADGAGALVQAAETVDGESLARFAALAPAPPELVLTARRAARLGLASGDDGLVALTLGEGIEADFVLRLADPTAGPPPEARGIAVRPIPGGIAAAAIELTKLARLLPAALLAPLDPSLDASGPAGAAALRDLLRVSAPEIAGYRTAAARSLRAVGEARVPLADAAETRIVAFRPGDGGVEHLAIVIGTPPPEAPVLTRLHSECFTGDLLGSLRCDCGDQLRGAIAEIARQGSGLLLYLAQEGRGIGLVNKLRAYRLQDRGADTLEANRQLGFEADERIYLPAAEMLRRLGFARVRLMTNNPDKVAALSRCGIAVVERVPHVFPANGHNERYLRTKAARFGHLF